METTTKTHEPECDAYRLPYEAWAARWPKHCQRCGGWGVLTTPATRWDTATCDPCVCQDSDTCPRCGVQGQGHHLVDYGREGDFGLCSDCGWSEYELQMNTDTAAMRDMAAPSDGSCICHEIQWERDAEAYEANVWAAQEVEDPFP
jgi:hypothetical protein